MADELVAQNEGINQLGASFTAMGSTVQTAATGKLVGFAGQLAGTIGPLGMANFVPAAVQAAANNFGSTMDLGNVYNDMGQKTVQGATLYQQTDDGSSDGFRQL